MNKFKLGSFFSLLLIGLLFINGGHAQNIALIDSLLLETRLQNHKKGNIQKALKTAYEAVKLSQKIEYERGLSVGFYTISVLLSDTQNFKKNIGYIEKAKCYKKHLGSNKKDEFNLLLLEASNNYELGFYSIAASLYKRAQKNYLRGTG